MRLAWTGVAVLGLCGILAGLLEAVLVPVYAGSTVVPVGVALALVTNVLLPRLAFALVPRTAAAAVPFATWLVAIVVFGIVARPEGDVILPGGSLQWASYAVLLGGALVGTVTVVTAVPPRTPRTPRTPPVRR